MIQEALNNVNKHAEATQCNVRIEFTRAQVNLLITDNGEGFDIDEVSEGKYGLINMRERCELINASISINSDKNGTRINVKIPIQNNEF